MSGFGVRVTDKGHKSFVLVTRYPGDPNRPVTRKIGDYPSVSIATAREVAREWREDIAKGVDPKDKAEAVRRDAEAARREAERRQANTFGQRSRPSGKSTWRRSAPATSSKASSRSTSCPSSAIGRSPRSRASTATTCCADSQEDADAREAHLVLSAHVRASGPKTRKGGSEKSPFANLKRFGKEQTRDRVLSRPEIRAIWRASAEMGVFGRAVRLLLATGQRRSEVGDMEWRELDDERKALGLAGERAKANRAHAVPLSPLALSILAELPEARRARLRLDAQRALGGGTIPISGWSKFKSRLDRAAIEALRQLTGDAQATIPEWRLHDLRRTAATLMTERGVSRLVVSKVLDHAERA